jgi:phage protein D
MVSVFKGLITRVDADFVGEGGDEAPRGRVIAYCPLHKLSRVQKTMHWESSTYSDAADALAGEVGLSTGATGTKISFDYLSVNSQNWLAFLTELARRTGGRLSYEEDKLVFAEADTSNNVGTLTFGENLTSAKFKADTAQLHNEVKVLAYNDKDKAQIIGMASDSDVTKFGGKEVGAAIVAEKYCESPLWITDYAARDQAEVDEVAKAIINDIASGFCSVEGATKGDPAIKAGAVVTIEGVTPNFAGDYYLTRVVHLWRASVEAGEAGNVKTMFLGSRNAWSPG